MIRVKEIHNRLHQHDVRRSLPAIPAHLAFGDDAVAWAKSVIAELPKAEAREMLKHGRGKYGRLWDDFAKSQAFRDFHDYHPVYLSAEAAEA